MKTSLKSLRGRRPKFNEPRKPVTMVLPERTLEQLAAIDRDRARAIVKLAAYETEGGRRGLQEVEVVNVAPGAGVILVGPLRALRRLDSLQLVEVVPGRFLLTIPTGTAIERLEMELMDLLEDLPREMETERSGLEKLRAILGQQRKKKAVSKREFLLIAT